MRVMAGIPLGIAAGAVLCRLWLARAPRIVAVDLAQPIAVVTHWHGFGVSMWLALFVGIALASIAYALTMRYFLDHALPSATRALVAICAASALGALAALLFPVIFSSDVYAYAAYGAMQAHGVDPYAHAPLNGFDPVFSAAIWQWGNPPPVCVYGPAFIWLAQWLVTAFAHGGVAAQLLALRVAASLALVACAPLAYLATAGRPTSQRLTAAAGIALNPVAIWCAAEGHNDALMLAVVLAGFFIARRSNVVLGAFVIAASALIKAPGIGAALAFALYAFRDRARFARVAIGTVCGIAVTAAIALPFEWGLRNVLVPHGHYTPQFSAQALFADAFLPALGSGALTFGMALTLLGCGALLLYGARITLTGSREGFLWMALAVWLAIPNPYPWYALWILPVAFAGVNSRASYAIVLASLAIVVRYLPEASVSSGTQLSIIVTMCAIVLPLAIAIVRAPALRPVSESET